MIQLFDSLPRKRQLNASINILHNFSPIFQEKKKKFQSLLTKTNSNNFSHEWRRRKKGKWMKRSISREDDRFEASPRLFRRVESAICTGCDSATRLIGYVDRGLDAFCGDDPIPFGAIRRLRDRTTAPLRGSIDPTIDPPSFSPPPFRTMNHTDRQLHAFVICRFPNCPEFYVTCSTIHPKIFLSSRSVSNFEYHTMIPCLRHTLWIKRIWIYGISLVSCIYSNLFSWISLYESSRIYLAILRVFQEEFDE